MKYKTNQKCWNCKQIEEIAIQVKRKGKKRWFCDDCLRGYYLSKIDKKNKKALS